MAPRTRSRSRAEGLGRVFDEPDLAPRVVAALPLEDLCRASAASKALLGLCRRRRRALPSPLVAGGYFLLSRVR